MTRKALSVLNVQSVLTQAAWISIRILIGYRALDDGAAPWFLAVLATTFAIPALLVAFPAGRWSDKFGGSVVALAGLLIASMGIVVMVSIPGLAVLLGASAIVGLGNLLVMVGQQTFVAHTSRVGASDGPFGALSAAASLGQMIGPPVVMVVASLENNDLPNTALGFSVCVLFYILALPLHVCLRPVDAHLRSQRAQEPRPSAARPKPKLLIANLWRSLSVSAAVLVTLDLLYTFVPVWAVEQGIGATEIGALLALRAAISFISRIGLARLVSRYGRQSILLVSISVATCGLLCLPFVNVFGAIPVMVALGIGLGPPQPLTMAWVVARTDVSQHGAALGLRLSANRLGQTTLPLAVGAIAAPLGVVGIFGANAALLIGSIVIVWRAGTAEGESP